MGVPGHLFSPQLHPQLTKMADAGAELKRLEKWLAKTEEKLDGGKIVKPDSIGDACQALSKARELRAQFEKKLTDFYLSKTEALCVIWASGQVNADIPAIEKAIQASGSKVKMSGEDLKACVLEIQEVLVN